MGSYVRAILDKRMKLGLFLLCVVDSAEKTEEVWKQSCTDGNAIAQ